VASVVAHSLVRNFVPPILLKRKRVGDRLAALLLRASTAKSLETLRYEQLQREVETTPEITKLFPGERMREHWGYARLENTPQAPNLYIHQLRFYRMVQYFRQACPSIFDAGTRILDIGDTSGMLFRAIGKCGLSLNLRPDRVAYMRSHGIEAVVGNAEALEFEDNSFEYVFCFQTLEHIKGPVKALEEMGRVAGSAVFLSIPYTETTHIWGRDRFIHDYRGADDVEAKRITDDECHVIEFSSSDLIKLLTFTPLKCTANFTLAYFGASGQRSWMDRLVARLTPSHFNFFVLTKWNHV
jgi:SAM-dependent methyltransferase